MAYIEERRGGWLVVWREDGGPKQSRLVAWNDRTDEDFAVSKEDARAQAELLVERKRMTERAYRQPLDRVIRQNAQDGYSPSIDYVGAGEEGLRFETYVGALIEEGAITESAKHTYRHTLMNHIAGTPLGRQNIRMIEPSDLQAFWNALDVGDGAQRNIAQVLRKGFTTALKRDDVEVNPMTRADLQVPSKRLRVRGPIQVLEPEDLAALAAAARSPRDRLIIKVMGYGGLRAGECGGLTRRDIVRRGAYCKLRLHQQVVRVGREKKITPLKTEAAQRRVPVPCALVDEIDAFLAETPPAEDGRVFHGVKGSLVAGQAINHAVQKAAERAHLGPVNSHLLRHTAASMWFDDGMDAESVRRALGHTDIKTTLGLYAHMLQGGAAKLAESMGRRMNGGAA